MILNSTSDQSQGGQGTPFPPANGFKEETEVCFFKKCVYGVGGAGCLGPMLSRKRGLGKA